MDLFKVITVGIIALLTVNIVLQNTETVEIKRLFFSLSVSRATLLSGAMTIGSTAGVLVANRLAFQDDSEDTSGKAVR